MNILGSAFIGLAHEIQVGPNQTIKHIQIENQSLFRKTQCIFLHHWIAAFGKKHCSKLLHGPQLPRSAIMLTGGCFGILNVCVLDHDLGFWMLILHISETLSDKRGLQKYLLHKYLSLKHLGRNETDQNFHREY